MNSSAIEVSGLRQAYGDKVVLDGIDFDVPRGSVFSMLGPNGAGKTTTVNALTTLVKADAGSVRVAGYDVATETKKVRAVIGVTGQFAAVDELLSGRENLQLIADLKRVRSGDRVVTQLLERFDLVESAPRMVATYSGGMRRKLDLAMTLVGDPQIIFLDEPTTGLDPRSRRTMWAIVRELVTDGVTVFLTTQYLEEADQLADRIAVLDQGRLVAQGTPEELKRQAPGTHALRGWGTGLGVLLTGVGAFAPGIAVLITFTAALCAWVPGASPLAWALFMVVIVERFFGRLLELPDAISGLSPFWWVGDYPNTPVEPSHMIGLGAVAVVLLALAVVGFRRRDLTAG